MNRLLIVLGIFVACLLNLASGCGTRKNQLQNTGDRSFAVSTVVKGTCDIANGVDCRNLEILDHEFPVLASHLEALFSSYSKKSDKSIQFHFNIDPSLITKGFDDFVCEVTSRKIELKVAKSSSLPAAISWLRQFIQRHNGKLPLGTIHDYSNIENRAFHIVISGSESLNQVKTWIDSIVLFRFNTLMIQITPGIQLEHLSIDPNERETWSKKQLSELIEYAKASGLNVIPELKLLTKQKKLFAPSRPDLLYNEQTYDPEKKEVYSLVFPLIDELLDLFKPTYFHIGHDELHGIKGKEETADVQVLPVNAFISDINKLHVYLEKKGIRTMMWSDMLLNPKDFPSMKKVSLHAMNGYENCAASIPKNIIQCDWHYKDELDEYPSVLWLEQQGFEVWGATWDNMETIRRFSTFMAKSTKTRSMIATTWHRALKTVTVGQIIETAGNAFWNS